MKRIFLFFLIIISPFAFTQQNKNWKGYFSYNKVKDISQSNNKLFFASDNTLFSKDLSTQELKTFNTIDGLSGEKITTIYSNKTLNKTIIGHENGLIIAINNNDNSLKKVVGILNNSMPNSLKKINHFEEHNGILYISCDFGIVQFNLASLEFGDTYYIGNNGEKSKIYQTTFLNDEIYAVTENNGIKKASLSNPNLIDYNQWEIIDSGTWKKIAVFNNQLIGINSNNDIYKFNNGSPQLITNLGQPALDLRTTNDYIITTTANVVSVLNSSFNYVAYFQSYQFTSAPTFNCGAINNDRIYIGTNEKGVLSVSLFDVSNYESLMPDGPSRNYIFSIKATSSDLWMVYGGYNYYYNPYEFGEYSLPLFGLSKLSKEGWLHIPSSKVFDARSLSKITVNPKNESQVYISSFHSGLLKTDNDIPSILYNQTNSGLETLTFDGDNISVRINGTAFDKEGNLWITNSMVKNGLKVLKKDGNWQSYNMESILGNYKTNSMNQIVIDKNNTKWIATINDGVIAFNEKTGIFKKISVGPDSGNLPDSDVRTIAVDNHNQLWIGTSRGLRVLPNVGNYNNSNPLNTNSIVILEEGVPQELLYEQFITDIVVNGSNEKWIGTADSGVFLFSSNGQETIYHFTKDNSPLPSNTITDIDINPLTGEVLFATNKGMVSFQGSATEAFDNLKNVYVYPNPVRPNYTGTVKIAGLVSNANVKITDIEGNLVYETTSEGGTIEWDTTAFGNYKVASGVYMIFISAKDTADTTVKKVMIIR